jgi:predicted amidophosphoribosyltransferase
MPSANSIRDKDRPAHAASRATGVHRSTIEYPPYASSWLQNCIEILLPSQCTICRRPLRGTTVCYRCRPPLPDLTDLCARSCPRCFSILGATPAHSECETCTLFPPLADSIRFLWEYDGLARDLIRTMKYRPSMSLATLAGALLNGAVPFLFPPGTSWDLIIPIPASRAMFRRRLFHPCQELARPISQSMKIPLLSPLYHDHKRAPQASLTHEERLRRIRSLFSLARRFDARGRRILLVEDVITTGATIGAAAHVLRQAGALRVDVLALARTRVWKRFRQRLYKTFHENAHSRPKRSLE